MKVLILQDDEFEQVRSAIDDRHDAIENGDIRKKGKEKADALKALKAAERACYDADDAGKTLSVALKGNPLGGMVVVGPYVDEGTAEKSMEDCQDDYWITELLKPED